MSNSLIVGNDLWKLKRSSSESMWDDLEIGFDKSKYAEYYDDFFNYVAGDWTVTETGSGSRAIQDAVSGVLLVTNANGASDLNNLQKVGEAFLPAAGKKIWYESRFYIGDVSSSTVIMGLSVTDTSLGASAPANGIYFSNTADSALAFTSRASSVSSSESGLLTTADSIYVKVGFKVIGTGLVEYWVNDVKQGSITTNIPATELRVSFCVNNGTTAAETLGIDYIRAIQER